MSGPVLSSGHAVIQKNTNSHLPTVTTSSEVTSDEGSESDSVSTLGTETYGTGDTISQAAVCRRVRHRRRSKTPNHRAISSSRVSPCSLLQPIATRFLA